MAFSYHVLHFLLGIAPHQTWHLLLDINPSEKKYAMKIPLEIELQIERQTIDAHVVHHLPITKAYADRIGLVPTINRLVECDYQCTRKQREWL